MSGRIEQLCELPHELRAHIRYPEDFFLIQADIYRTYHMTDAEVFYNREDLWNFPPENFADETTAMQPYYVIMRLPGETNAVYVLMLPMVPQGRDNMISWLAARCDGADYGHLFEFAFSKDKLFYGLYQIQARINQPRPLAPALAVEPNRLEGNPGQSARDTARGCAALRRAAVSPRGERSIA
jgi:uncharacterized protein